jgi:hemerythrin HHE cation binding domain-containing protein
MRYCVKKSLSLIVLIVFALAPVQGFGQRDHYRKSQRERKIQFKIPESLKAEHLELHEELARAIKAGGRTAEAARAVEDVLHPHFLKEEEYALPPLGLLSSLAEGNVTPEMRAVIAMTDKLKADLPHMLQEHRAIVAALERLSATAKQEGKTEHALFAEKLMMHARNEEEVLYPAAILVGEYLKMKLK